MNFFNKYILGAAVKKISCDEINISADIYNKARNMYRPERARVIFVFRSPRKREKDKQYKDFYFSEKNQELCPGLINIRFPDHPWGVFSLFMKVINFYNPLPHFKDEGLREFAQRGYYIINSTDNVLVSELFESGEIEQAGKLILDDFSKLCDELRSVSILNYTKIMICQNDVYNLFTKKYPEKKNKLEEIVGSGLLFKEAPFWLPDDAWREQKTQEFVDYLRKECPGSNIKSRLRSYLIESAISSNSHYYIHIEKLINHEQIGEEELMLIRKYLEHLSKELVARCGIRDGAKSIEDILKWLADYERHDGDRSKGDDLANLQNKAWRIRSLGNRAAHRNTNQLGKNDEEMIQNLIDIYDWAVKEFKV